MRGIPVSSVVQATLLLASLFALGSPRDVGAQPSSRPWVLELGEAVGGGPPDIDVLANGTVVFRIETKAALGGDLEGTLAQRITQVFDGADEDGLLPISTLWKIKTSAGVLEGYYSGTFIHLEDGSHEILQSGRVLRVSKPYADLYQAEIFYLGTLDFGHSVELATLTIAAPH